MNWGFVSGLAAASLASHPIRYLLNIEQGKLTQEKILQKFKMTSKLLTRIVVRCIVKVIKQKKKIILAVFIYS